MSVTFREVVIDCGDPRSLARFWAAATGYEVDSDLEDWASVVLADPEGNEFCVVRTPG